MSLVFLFVFFVRCVFYFIHTDERLVATRFEPSSNLFFKGELDILRVREQTKSRNTASYEVSLWDDVTM